MQIPFILKKNLDLHLRNDTDLFLYWEKLKSTFRKDVDLYLYLEKFISTTRKDADLFLYWEKFRSTSKKDADLFYLKKKDLFFFFFLKRVDYMQIFKTKKQIISTMKELRTYFHELN